MERRREDRVAVNGTGKLSWLEGLITRTEDVRVENVAGNGLRIRLLTPLQVPQIVRLGGPELRMPGAGALLPAPRRPVGGRTAVDQVDKGTNSTQRTEQLFLRARQQLKSCEKSEINPNPSRKGAKAQRRKENKGVLLGGLCRLGERSGIFFTASYGRGGRGSLQVPRQIKVSGTTSTNE